MKKTISIILAAVLFIIPLTAFAYATEDDTNDDVTVCTIASDTAEYIFTGGGNESEIHITPAKLTVDGFEENIYLVGLKGVGYNPFKTNNIVSAFQSAFNVKSAYLTLVKKTVTELVPEGANIVFTGHSLGGMVEQQLICDTEITERYEILYTLTAGSPYIMTDASLREGTLTRLADKNDTIPKFSPASLFDIANQKNAIKEDGGYSIDANAAHNKSYRNADEWGAYDALGVKGGTAVITFNNADVIGRSA